VTPLEALEPLTNLVGYEGVKRQPGAIVRKCSAERREALSRLTSEELATARVPEWICRSGGRRGRMSV